MLHYNVHNQKTTLCITRQPIRGNNNGRKFELYKDKAGEFRFRLKSGCTNGIESVKKNAPNDKLYERKATQSGKFMFNLKAGNHQVIGTSQSYDSEASRDKGIESVKNNAPDAKIDDQT